MSLEHLTQSHGRDAELAAFEHGLAGFGVAPLWRMMRTLAPRAPGAAGEFTHWRWRELRTLVLEAGTRISAEDAERRVLILENPAFRGQGKATSSLYSGVQLILPGEIAPSHRHTAAALRLVLEGQGGYTTIDGERVAMAPGDFLITPPGVFHDHGNQGSEPVMWLDGLDVFIVNLLNAGFGEDNPEKSPAQTRLPGETRARVAEGLAPWPHDGVALGPGLCHWPYDRTRRALMSLTKASGLDPALGLRMNYSDPSRGTSPLKTMAASIQLLPAGFGGAAYRSTAGSVFSVVEGHGRVRVGESQTAVAAGDIFIVPSWQWHQFEADADLVLFSFSDEALQRHLGFWRDERRAGGMNDAAMPI